MTGLIDYLRLPFDLLYARSSNETTEHSIYADTRSREGQFPVRTT